MNELWFFWRLFNAQKPWLYGGILLALLTTFAGLGLLMLSGWFITAAAVAGLTLADANAVLFNFMLPAAQIRALAIIRTLGRYAERLVTHEATFRGLADLRGWFFERLIPLAPGRLSMLGSREVLSRLTADIDALDALYLRLILPICSAAIGLTFILVFLAYHSVLSSVITACLLLTAAVAVPWLFNYLGRAGAEAVVTLAAQFRTQTLDVLQGLADLLNNQASTRFMTGLTQGSDALVTTQRRNNRLAACSAGLTLMLTQLSVGLVLGLSIRYLPEGRLSGPALALCVFSVIAAFEWIMPLPLALQMLGKTQAAARRLLQVATLPPTIMQPASPLDLPQTYALQLDLVSFRYQDQLPWVVKTLSLSIPQGAKIALVGASGSGKTTVLNLLMRFYDPTQGQVLLAGEPLHNYSHEALLTCFGVLSQRSQLFSATLKENLLLAKPQATAQELAVAIEAAGLNAFIQSLPGGLQTWVGESGVNVSGGEARRIALARLYLKNPPILLLDEPTEGLDSETELAVLEALMAFAQGKTLIMVTHRTVGLSMMDQVYRMAQGGLMSPVPDRL